MTKYLGLIAIVFFAAQACSPEKTESTDKQETRAKLPEAIGLDGTIYYTPQDPPEVFQKKDSLMQIAVRNWEADTTSIENLIWYGRRVAYLGRYNEAIDIFSEGIARFPDSPELYRHRGHRYITIRQFGKAIQDFEQAAALAKDLPVTTEPDGLPNKLNIPLSSLQFNIYYHWALAHYLRGEFEEAARQFENCQLYANNPDLIVAVVDWLYMTYRRLGREKDATALLNLISDDMVIIENDAYYQRLLFYKGEKKAEELLNLDAGGGLSEDLLSLVTQGYGVGNWYLYNGDTLKAREIFDRVTSTAYWSAFGFIAAEADAQR